jgi:hypothetical protein
MEPSCAGKPVNIENACAVLTSAKFGKLGLTTSGDQVQEISHALHSDGEYLTFLDRLRITAV